jgi:hypothetical protein
MTMPLELPIEFATYYSEIQRVTDARASPGAK